jgi:trimethylamine--corrinoid protein Co-methyltransferase
MNQLDALTIPCALLYPSEVPAEISQLVQTATMLKSSKKPIYGPGISLAGNAKYIARLFKLYGGDKLQESPIGMVGISPESPLFLPKEITDTLRYTAEAGIPISVLSAPMGGLTSPMSVIGTIAQAHAEILGFATLSYLINPACVLFYGSRTFFANMKNAQCILGLPETGISSAICAQLATHLGWVSDFYGLSCTSCAMDEQTGYEKMMNALLPAMAGGTLITGFGSTASVMCCSLSQLVIDNDIMNMIYRAHRANDVTEDFLGFDALEAVVNDGETFMEQEHTIEDLKSKEIWQPEIGFDSVWADWISRGEVPLAEKAERRAQELLRLDEEDPADTDLDKEVDALLDEAKKELLS